MHYNCYFNSPPPPLPLSHVHLCVEHEWVSVSVIDDVSGYTIFPFFLWFTKYTIATKGNSLRIHMPFLGRTA